MSAQGRDREQLLSRAFVGLADTLVDDYDMIELLDRLISYSVELLAADAAGILVADSQRTLRVVASSQEDAEVMELLRLQADLPGLLSHPCSDKRPGSGRGRRAVAGVRGRCRAAGGVSIGACATAATAGRSGRDTEPVPPSTRPVARH